MGVLLTATSLNHSSVVTDYETFVSILQLSALKMAVKGMAETFAPNNHGPRAYSYSPASRSSHNIEAGHGSLRQNLTLKLVLPCSINWRSN